MAKSIDVSDLDIYYGSFKAVEGVTIPLAARSVTAFIGPSGCGKSTFLRSLNRMHEVIPGARVEGKIVIDGRDLYDAEVDPVEVRRQIGMVFQRPNPFPTMSIYENVIAGKRLNGKRLNKAVADEAVEKSLRGANLWNEVKDRLNKPGSGLSGGQQQRLCIARAIAVEPQVLLMDEPCSALDPISTSAIEDLIHELKESYTIIIVTHNMQQAARVSETTAFFNLAGVGQPGQADRVRPDRQDLLQPRQPRHRGLHLRPLRLSESVASRGLDAVPAGQVWRRDAGALGAHLTARHAHLDLGTLILTRRGWRVLRLVVDAVFGYDFQLGWAWSSFSTTPVSQRIQSLRPSVSRVARLLSNQGPCTVRQLNGGGGTFADRARAGTDPRADVLRRERRQVADCAAAADCGSASRSPGSPGTGLRGRPPRRRSCARRRTGT